jgi:hypothetical protein
MTPKSTPGRRLWLQKEKQTGNQQASFLEPPVPFILKEIVNLQFRYLFSSAQSGLSLLLLFSVLNSWGLKLGPSHVRKVLYH